MFPLKRYAVALPLCALAACGSDRSVNPVVEKVAADSGAGITSANVVSQFDLQVGQRVTIKPRTTTRTSRLRWNSTNTGVASVSSTGTVTANRTGTATVTVSGGWVAENYTVAVTATAAPTVTAFTLQPAIGVSLLPGQTQQFTPAASWSDGQQYPLSVTYSATGGTISSTGLFTAGSTAGRFSVIATCVCGLVASSTVDVAQLVSLSISPKTVTVAAGGSQVFTTTALWGTGATALPPVAYSATGGSITATGQYTAPTVAGTYRVIVAHSNGTVRDTATVTVSSTTQPAPPTGSFTPFLPAGLTLVTDTDFGNLAAKGDYNQDGLAYFWDSRQAWDSNAPFSSGVYETFYPGNDAGNGGGGGLLVSPAGQQWRKVYFSMMIWVPSNYSIHTNGEKFFYPLVTTPGMPLQSTSIGWWPEGSQWANSPTFGFIFNSQVGGAGSFLVQPSISTVNVTKGRWTRIEMYCAMNTPGLQDGVWRVWIDGRVAVDVSNVRYSAHPVQSYFDGIRFTGTRGGGASTTLTPPEGQVRRYDRLAFYASPN